MSKVGSLLASLLAAAGCRTADTPEPEWPFDQPRNVATLTLRSIAFDGAPILHVTHDLDDHGWPFLGLQDADIADAALVAPDEIVKRHPSVRDLADLPPGWHAWRESKDSPWQREEMSAELIDEE